MRFTKILKRFAILATRLFFAGLSLELSTVSYSAEAATAVPTELSPEERRTVSQAERYLNDIKTLQARFIQESSNGGVAQGRIYLSRPGKLRFEYDPPTPILIVSSGLVVTYYDRELEQVSEVLLSATPLDVLGPRQCGTCWRCDLDPDGSARRHRAAYAQRDRRARQGLDDPGIYRETV